MRNLLLSPHHYTVLCTLSLRKLILKIVIIVILSTMRATLTHWGRVTHICVSKLTTFGSDSGLSPGRRQAIIWTNGGILLIGPLGTNFSEILIEIQTFSLKKIRLKMSSAKYCSFRLGLNVLIIILAGTNVELSFTNRWLLGATGDIYSKH